jgi:hypothetical protein
MSACSPVAGDTIGPIESSISRVVQLRASLAPDERPTGLRLADSWSRAAGVCGRCAAATKPTTAKAVVSPTTNVVHCLPIGGLEHLKDQAGEQPSQRLESDVVSSPLENPVWSAVATGCANDFNTSVRLLNPPSAAEVGASQGPDLE